MANRPVNPLLRFTRRLAAERACSELTDSQLLERFVTSQDEAVFEALVRRHGQVVWWICHRILHNPHDADDAFQATFLVLVRKAASIRPAALVGNWLYGVAYHVAVKARAMSAKRMSREKNLPTPLAEAEAKGIDPRIVRAR